MAYSSLTDLYKVLPENIVRDLADDEILDTTFEAATTEIIAQADAEIDTYLGGRYAVPLTSVPVIIRRCSCDITIYIMCKRRLGEIPDTRRGAYKDALRILEQIRDGKMDLPELTAAGALAFSAEVSSHFGDD